MAILQDLRDHFPPGAAPRFARKWGLGALMVGVALIVFIFGRPATNRSVSRPATTGTGNNVTSTSVGQLEAQLARQQQELLREQQALASSKQAAGNAQQEAAGLLSGIQDPRPTLEQQQQMDPIAIERARFEVELYKRDRLRAFANPEAMTLRDVYSSSRQPVESGPPPEPQDKPAAATTPAAETDRKYIVREGNFLETVLVNRLDSTFSGPVIVQVSNPLWARDRQTMLVPKGTQILGEARAVTALGASRVAVVFHRMIRPDDVAIDLDRFTGLNQIGETGLKDKVNHHYLQIFGVSIALGVIGAAAQGSASYGFQTGGWDMVRSGFGQGMSTAAMQVMNRFLNIPPTVTIREGHRVKVYFTQDLEVPAYKENE